TIRDENSMEIPQMDAYKRLGSTKLFLNNGTTEDKDGAPEPKHKYTVATSLPNYVFIKSITNAM
ncbi:MAG: hypothetical protein K2Q01_12450, partial [Rickettsiales bacterium]|nr:hypothetical protein [Rickettsiales bacterium]